MQSQPAVLRVVLMAGGKGERLWPKSTQAMPKQYLPLLGHKSLLRTTFERLLGLVPVSSIYVVTEARYSQLTLQELPELSEQNIIAEPEGRNTAPALGLAALWLEAEHPDATMIALPADHYVLGERKFRVTLEAAVQAAQRGGLCTLGVQATRPETGYGYIQLGEVMAEYRGLPVHRVLRFIEKPDAATAQQLLKVGGYLWNSGMLICQAKVLRQEIARHLPALHALLEELRSTFRIPGASQSLMAERFGSIPRISLDHGVLEKSDLVCTIPAYFGWHDVGNWAALERLRPRDDDGNAVQGDVVLHDTHNSFVDADSGRVVAVVGLKDLIVVDTDSAVLICAKDRAHEVKRVAELAAPFARQALRPAMPDGKMAAKPWGWEVWWAETDAYAARIMEIMAGQSVSRQFRTSKWESLYIQAGQGRMLIGDSWQEARQGQVFTLPAGTVRQIEAISDLTMIEVSAPELVNAVRLGEPYAGTQEE